MKTAHFILSSAIAFFFLNAPLLSVAVSAQDPQSQPQATALMRGYRTGYTDGYQSGINDRANGAQRNFRNKSEYEHADRAYNSNYGKFDDYRDGYQQGFEAGYNAGFDHKPFDSSIPPDLKLRSQDESIANAGDSNSPGSPTPRPIANGIAIPRDTIMTIELQSNLSTDVTKKGDVFEARVLEPKDYDGASVLGHVAQVKRAGKAKGTAQLQLSFDEIRMPDGRAARLNAQVIEVVAANGDVGKVDPEGGVQGKDSTKSDVKKVGAATGIGAIIGAIAGGGVGAAVGATIGAGVGTAGVLTERGQDIHLYQGQRLRIRTNSDTALP